MEQILILLVMLAGVTHAIFPVADDTMCNATQNTSCSVAVGRSVYIQVMTNATGHQVWFKKLNGTDKEIVFTLKKEKVTLNKKFQNRTQFFTNNGTLKITNVELSDSGQYSVEIFDPEGLLLRDTYVHLDVQEQTFFTQNVIFMIAGVAALLLLVVLVIVCVCRKFR